ncbi:MAG: hypothetical protein A2521_12755 [Deltaproteobacteria bacterium RIFOXYD12_FULL_57_12]|nr:MAG: hypothetical protein A2521_12755 [Deltaproteobacteria bacterium RIFOXYD12_FULL_57_12]
MNIKNKLATAFLLLALPPLIITTLLFYFSEKNALTSQVLNHLASVASIQHNRITDILSFNRERLNLVTSRTQLRASLAEYLAGEAPEPRERMNRILRDVCAVARDFHHIHVYSPTGIVVASSDLGKIGERAADQAFFQSGLKGNNVDQLGLDADGKPVFYLSGPLILNGQLLGVALIEVATDSFVSTINDYTGLGASGETVLATRDEKGAAVFIAPTRFEKQAALKLTIPGEAGLPINQAFTSEQTVFMDAQDYRGVPVLAATRYIEGTDWGLVVKINRAEALAPLHETQKLFGIAALLVSLLVTLFSLILSRGITRPIMGLAATATAISDEKLEMRADETIGGEIGLLASAFNRMTNNLLKARQLLVDKISELQAEVRIRQDTENALRLDEERLESLLTLSSTQWQHRQELIDFGLEEAVRLTRSKGGYLHFVDEEKGSIDLYSWSREVRAICKAEKNPHYPLASAGIWADCLRRREPVVHNDYQHEAGKKGYPEGHFAVHRHMSVPVFDRKKIIGIVGVGNKEEPYNGADIRQLSLFMSSMWQILLKQQAEDERERVEEQLLQAHKMEAIGTLAGGIAHDFNNILQGILGYADLSRDHIPESNPAREMIDQVLRAGKRASELVNHILTFSRKSEQQRKPLQAQLLVKETIQLLRASLPASTEIRSTVQTSGGIILAEPSQIHQLLVNLATNAAQAMDENGGILEISLENVALSAADLTDEPDRRPGDYVRISVRDTGKGIAPEIIDRIFEPYFTTKERRGGYGMGLAIVHGIVRSHDGIIRVASRPGEGTRFDVYFPAVESETREETEMSGSLPRGSERILVVDDEAVIAELLSQRLKTLGYQVTATVSSRAALEMFRSQPDGFDLVITDQSMPEMSGVKLIRELRQIKPDVPVILCTGYSSKVDAESADGHGINAFFMKPVELRTLSSMVRRLLDKKTA